MLTEASHLDLLFPKVICTQQDATFLQHFLLLLSVERKL